MSGLLQPYPGITLFGLTMCRRMSLTLELGLTTLILSTAYYDPLPRALVDQKYHAFCPFVRIGTVFLFEYLKVVHQEQIPNRSILVRNQLPQNGKAGRFPF